MAAQRRTILWLVAAGVATVLGFFGLRPKALEVETALVSRGSLSTAVEGEALTRVRDRYVVTAPVSGNLLRITLNAGDSITRGALLARIAPAQQDPQSQALARARVAAAEAMRQEASVRVRQASDASAQADRAKGRLAALQAAGAISLQQLEDVEQAAQTARDELLAAVRRNEGADAELSAASTALSAVDAATAGAQIVGVASPTGGRVLRIAEHSERVVAAGTPLMEIGNPERLEVVIDVLSTDAVRVSVGDRVELAGWGGDSTLLAEVDLIEPSAVTRVSALGVDEQRVNVIAHFLGKPLRLGDGFRADARIVNWSADGVLIVPLSALFRSGKEWHAYSVGQGNAQLVKVAVGHVSDAAAEVLSGLAEGDEVVLFPSDQLRNGLSVKPRPGG